MKVWIVVGCLLGASFIIGFAVWRTGQRERERPALTSDSRTSGTREPDLRAQIDALAEDLRQLKAQRQEEAALPRPTIAASVEPIARTTVPPPAAPIDPEELARQADEAVMQQFEALERGLAREPVDARWSKAAQDTLLATYQGGDFAGTVVQASCRSTFCQVKFDVSAAGAPELTSRLLSSRAPWQAASMMRFDTETNRGELYVAREDYELLPPN